MKHEGNHDNKNNEYNFESFIPAVQTIIFASSDRI